MCPRDRGRKKSTLFILASTGLRVLLFFGLLLEEVDRTQFGPARHASESIVGRSIPTCRELPGRAIGMPE